MPIDTLSGCVRVCEFASLVRRPRVAAKTTWLLLALALCVGMAGCEKKGQGQAAAEAPPPKVEYITVAPTTIPIQYEFVGMTEPSKVVEIRARVSGFLLARGFEEGKSIMAGDPLFQIDPRPYEADLEIVRARLDQAKSRLRLAQLEADRFAEAAAKGAAAQRELDRTQTELAEAKSSVRLAEANVSKAELDLSYTEIKSPVTGVIGRTLQDEGSYLDAGPQSLLAEAMQIDPMYVVFAISERDWLKWREDVASGTILGDKDNPPVKVKLLDGTTYAETGKMTFFDTRVDSRTGAASARASFANPQGELKPGQFVKAQIVGWQRPNSIVVPTRAVLQNPMGSIVMIVDPSDMVQIRPVTLGQWHGDGWLILNGLKAGDRVITDGFMHARPGMKVVATPATALESKQESGTQEAGKPAEGSSK